MGLGAAEAFGTSPRLEVTLGSPCWAGCGGRTAYQALPQAWGRQLGSLIHPATGLRGAGR